MCDSLMLVFLEEQDQFDEFDEEEMHGLLSAAPTCPSTNARQSHVAEDAWGGPFDPMGFGAQGGSAAEAPEESVETLFEPVGKETEIL